MRDVRDQGVRDISILAVLADRDDDSVINVFARERISILAVLADRDLFR